MKAKLPLLFCVSLVLSWLSVAPALAASVTVSVSPTTASLRASSSQKFTATVHNNSNTKVTWQVNGVTGGNSTTGRISTSGTYTAPSTISALAVVTVKAVSQADTSKSASAQVTLNPVSVTISPTSASLYAGASKKFTATVKNSSSTSVTWQVNGITSGNSTVGTISSSGTYNAPSNLAVQTVVTVSAVSKADTSKSASAKVTLTVPVSVSISISPKSASLIGGATQAFTATVQNTSNTSVTWQVNGVTGGNSTVGTISSSGSYKAPSKIPSSTVVTVTAISSADTSKADSAQVTLNPIMVSINPLSSTLLAGAQQQFTATVQNASSSSVTWLVNGTSGGSSTVGTVSGSGLYTAPATVASQTIVSVTARSNSDSSKTASAQVTVNPPVPVVSVSINPTSAILAGGGTKSFTAIVQNATNPAVTWSVSNALTGDTSGVGTISDGFYTAPAVTVQTLVSVKAVLQEDPTKFGTATVTINPDSVSVAPVQVTLGAGQTKTFIATVVTSGSPAVTWSVDNVVGGDDTKGRITVDGEYAAPASIAALTTVTVNAALQSDATKYGTAMVTLSPVTVTVSPTTPTVAINKTQQFTANVQYTSTPGVTWQVNNVEGGDDTNGHISATGLYMAPASVPAGTVTVTAISVADTLQSDSTQVTVAASTGNNYYVSTTGSDSAAGTLAAPWKTISHAAAAGSGVKAGDTVFVRAGVYKETVAFAISGTAANGPITFQSYPNETAIIDGTGLAALSQAHGLIHIDSRNYLIVKGFEIRNYQTTSSSLVPAGIWITGSASNIQILNNLVHDIKTSSEANGQAYGISAYGSGSTPIDTLTIDGNQVYNLKTGGSESVNVDGNVTNFVITNNIIHDNDNIAIDAIGFEGVSSNSALDYARNGVISDNTIYNISGISNAGEGNDYDADGVYVDGGSQILIERNFIHNVDIGIEAAAEHKGKVSSYVTIRNNVIYASNSMGITIGGYDSQRGGTDHCTIVNNTLYGNDTKNTGSGELQVQYYATNNVFKNNIVYGTSQGLLVNSYTNSSANPVDIDYNLYFSPLSSGSAEFVWNGTSRSGLAAFRSATGKDTHSQYLNPLFLNVPSDLHVQPSSPAVDAGVDLTSDVNGTTDFSKNPRVQGGGIDIGAYEQ